MISAVFLTQLLRKEEQLQQQEAELRAAQRSLQLLERRHEESRSLNGELEIER